MTVGYTGNKKTNAVTAASNVRPGKAAYPTLEVKEYILTRTEKTVKRMPYGALFLICMFTVVVMFISYMAVRINEVSNEVSSLNTQLTSIRRQTVSAEAELAEKNDMTLIRELAESYGMVREDTLPSRHITVEQKDRAKVLKTVEPERDYSPAALLSSFGNNIKEFIEYLR